MADWYDEYQRQDFLRVEAEARQSDGLEADASPVFHALAEGEVASLIRYLSEMGDIKSVTISRSLASHLADMLRADGKSLFRLNIVGRARGEQGRKKRLRIRQQSWLIGYCAERLIEDVHHIKNAKWAKGEVEEEFSAGKTKVESCLQFIRKYLEAKVTNRRMLDELYAEEYETRFRRRVEDSSAKLTSKRVARGRLRCSPRSKYG